MMEYIKPIPKPASSYVSPFYPTHASDIISALNVIMLLTITGVDNLSNSLIFIINFLLVS